MKVPAMNVHIDPRAAQGMSELQKNSDALKGFPMLSYVSMVMGVTADGQAQQAGSQNGAQNQQPSNPPPSKSASSPDTTDSPSAVLVKGFGNLFGKKKPDNSSASSNANTPPPNPNSNPNSLMEITTQVNSFSDSSLDGSLFDVPVGFTQLQEDPSQVYNGGTPQRQQLRGN